MSFNGNQVGNTQGMWPFTQTGVGILKILYVVFDTTRGGSIEDAWYSAESGFRILKIRIPVGSTHYMWSST